MQDISVFVQRNTEVTVRVVPSKVVVISLWNAVHLEIFAC